MEPILDGSWAWAFYAAYAMLSLAFVLTFFRLAIGPTLPDRVVALDLTSYEIIAFTAVYAVHTDEPNFLNVALALGLIAFLGTIAFARYIEETETSEAGDA